jgi:hypothetical protein
MLAETTFTSVETKRQDIRTDKELVLIRTEEIQIRTLSVQDRAQIITAEIIRIQIDTLHLLDSRMVQGIINLQISSACLIETIKRHKETRNHQGPLLTEM